MRVSRSRTYARDSVLRLSMRLHLDAGVRKLLGPQLRVINLHETPKRHAATFEQQLRWVRDHFDVLTPDRFLEHLDGRAELGDRSAVLLTFDDGVLNNATVAAPLLEKLGMRALFFINPAFAQLDGEAARRFYVTRTRRNFSPDGLVEADDGLAIGPDALRALRARGHMVGNHTNSHQDLREVADAALDAEIRGARDTLSGWIGEPVSCFAWTFDWNAITASAWRCALATHRYCFTACPGPGALAPGCVWRTSVHADDPPHSFPFFYSGLADGLWWSRRRQLAQIFTNASR